MDKIFKGDDMSEKTLTIQVSEQVYNELAMRGDPRNSFGNVLYRILFGKEDDKNE